ncbi:capsular biosynthesis protein, partial [Campylobacter lari]|nr:capsular biosynthesis protein [Campylobacter lari]
VLLFLEESKKFLEHPLNILKSKRNNTMFVFELNNEIQAASRTFFLFSIVQEKKVIFDERINIFEDMKFVIEYLVSAEILHKVKFLNSSIYYLRKRMTKNSTMDNATKNMEVYNNILKYGVLETLKKVKLNDFMERYITNVAFSQLIYNIRIILEDKCVLLKNKNEYMKLLSECFLYISQDTILSFNNLGNNIFYKVGILNCFKNEKPPFQIAYIEDYDPYKEQILITYYTGDDKDIESIIVDEEEVYADYEKIVKYDFLDRVFCYQKRLWVHIPKNAKDKLEVFINNKQAMIGWNVFSIGVSSIRNKFISLKKNAYNIWLLMDRDIEADDNAEHLYRYIMQNHPEQEIVFALRKESPDWERLEKEGFNLVECYSETFYNIASKVKYFISSHTPASFNVKLHSGQKFLFLGHGVDAVDISSWFNKLHINLRFVSSNKEYYSIVNNYNNYILTNKEVTITGQPRCDSLLMSNNYKNKKILIMPTWRLYLVQDRNLTFDRNLKDNFFESEYYMQWFSFLNNPYLKELVNRYGYQINFVPHFNMRDILNKCNFPSFINVSYRKNNESFQKIFQCNDLMITDYSSAAFEMAYLKKPVIYYHFDKEYFFSNHSYRKGWFEYEKDGFGPVVYSEEKLLLELENFFKNDCLLHEKYLYNITNLFKFIDCNNCKRVFDNIVNL